jgi:hypothetical protein
MQDPEIHRKRREVLRAIADVAVMHNLPLPTSIEIDSGLSLRLDDNDREGVHAWSNALTLELGDERALNCGRRFYDVAAKGTWRDGDIEVWSACDVDKAGEPA